MNVDGLQPQFGSREVPPPDVLADFAAEVASIPAQGGFQTEQQAREHAQQRGRADGAQGRPHDWVTGVPAGWSSLYYDEYHDAYRAAADARRGQGQPGERTSNDGSR